LYYDGKDVPQDYAKALEWHTKAAVQGLAKAQHILGNMYQHGQGVPQNFAKALEWYNKAAEQGFSRAQNNMGHLYQFGKGVLQDYGKATECYNKAAEQGLAEAQHNLGWLYFYDKGIKRDIVKGIHYLALAAAQDVENTTILFKTIQADAIKYIEKKVTPQAIKDPTCIENYKILLLCEEAGQNDSKDYLNKIRNVQRRSKKTDIQKSLIDKARKDLVTDRAVVQPAPKSQPQQAKGKPSTKKQPRRKIETAAPILTKEQNKIDIENNFSVKNEQASEQNAVETTRPTKTTTTTTTVIAPVPQQETQQQSPNPSPPSSGLVIKKDETNEQKNAQTTQGPPPQGQSKKGEKRAPKTLPAKSSGNQTKKTGKKDSQPFGEEEDAKGKGKDKKATKGSKKKGNHPNRNLKSGFRLFKKQKKAQNVNTQPVDGKEKDESEVSQTELSTAISEIEKSMEEGKFSDLMEALNARDVKTLSDVQLDQKTILNTLLDLEKLKLIEVKRESNSKIRATSLLVYDKKGEHPSFTTHVHNHDKSWDQQYKTRNNFYRFIAKCGIDLEALLQSEMSSKLDPATQSDEAQDAGEG